MALYVITYDVRAKNREDYQPLYDQLNGWEAAHLQDFVWLANLNELAKDVRDALKIHMRPDDTVCVIEIFKKSDWSTSHARKTGKNWLKSQMN